MWSPSRPSTCSGAGSRDTNWMPAFAGMTISNVFAPYVSPFRLAHGETVEPAGAAGADQTLHRAAARGMRRVPRMRRRIVAQARAIGMSQHRRSIGAALRPVAAGVVLVVFERRAVGL